MRTIHRRPSHPGGYISYAVVISLGVVLLMMMAQAYRSAMQSQQVQSDSQLRLDYTDKEDAVLRSIVNILPNRAMQAMQHESNLNTTKRNPMLWKTIFNDSLNLANARHAADEELIEALGLGDVHMANPSDSDLGTVSRIFDAIEPESGYVAPGINRSLGLGFPALLAQ